MKVFCVWYSVRGLLGHPYVFWAKFLFIQASFFTISPISVSQIEEHFRGKVIQKFDDPNYLDPRKRTTRIFINLPVGKNIRSLSRGRVVESGWLKGFNGLTVKIRTVNNLIVVYSCLSRINVSPGTDIWKNQILGTSGGGGDSCAPAPGVSLFLIKQNRRVNPLSLPDL